MKGTKKALDVSCKVSTEGVGRIPDKGTPELSAFLLNYFLSHDRERIRDFEDSFWVDIDDITDGEFV